MLEKFIFENHLGRRFVGLENGVYMNHSDLRDYSWNYDTINNRISRFFRSITERKLPLVVVGRSDEEAITVRNQILDLAEADIEAKIPGKVFVGDFYTNGYITASKKSEYLLSKRYCKIDLTLTSDDPTWYLDRKYVFVVDEAAENDIKSGTDYPYDYKYDYSHSMSSKTVLNDSFGSCPFKLRIYGPAVNPTVKIGGHNYTVNGTIGSSESLLIDSLTKKITLITALGAKTNWFDRRDRESYIFEPIPAGQSAVSWNGSFGFDLTVIEKRSEPKWI